ncbi:MAG TPA: flagellar biosynthetic protein FliO [Xanthobacteraceae bacterium]|jgi:hypothetical protein|nr:flagellar biosynthetic protein FliO [Xanthobacteraceae bacterium]
MSLDMFGEASILRFVVAFLIVLGLICATAWAVRRFGSNRLGANARGRQPRLAAIDYASVNVDGRRRHLILVRRDNVEHLLLIGGPSDLVVESNIVRATASPRDVTGTRPATGLDTLPRAIPLPENGGSWPLQPEANGGQNGSPTVSSRPSPRVEPLPDELPRLPQTLTEPPARPQRDTLNALADELSVRPTPPRSRPPMRPLPDELPRETHKEPEFEEALAETIEAAPEPHIEPHFEIPAPVEAEIPPPPEPVVAKPALRKPFIAPAPRPAPPKPTAAEATADQSLADMAQRLEAALRKPNAEARPATRPATANESVTEAIVPPPRPARPAPAELKPPRPEAKPGQAPAQGKTALYDSLEQEMANLLGRQNKT